jgi:hypothetical protein
LIILVVAPIEPNCVGDDSAYETQAFFGTVEKEIKKRTLRGGCRQKLQVGVFERLLGKRARAAAGSALRISDERVDGKVCQLLRRSLRKRTPELQDADSSFIGVLPPGEGLEITSSQLWSAMAEIQESRSYENAGAKLDHITPRERSDAAEQN